MGRLPPAEKLSLAIRKNVRDEWDNNKADLEKQLSDILGEPWTVEASPLSIWPYHNEGYAKESLGSCIKAYVEGALYQLKYLTERYESLASEINTIAHAHVLTLDVDENEPPRWSYNGCDVVEGQLRILFHHENLGVNVSDACQERPLFQALNTAADERPLSFLVRSGIKTDYEPEINATRHEIAELLGKSDDDIKLNPNWEDTFAKLKEYSEKKGSDLRDDWQSNLGSFTLKYFQALAYRMKYDKVGEDDMVQEGFLEAVSNNEMAFRIVDSLKYGSYGEVVIEDGTLYIQCPADKWGYNIDYVAEKLIDQL
ncbi:hypothetical protein V8F20_005435 [Naviculisporaceae sp. PSN 640]